MCVMHANHDGAIVTLVEIEVDVRHAHESRCLQRFPVRVSHSSCRKTHHREIKLNRVMKFRLVEVCWWRMKIVSTGEGGESSPRR
jgi:hypothetical protein